MLPNPLCVLQSRIGSTSPSEVCRSWCSGAQPWDNAACMIILTNPRIRRMVFFTFTGSWKPIHGKPLLGSFGDILDKMLGIFSEKRKNSFWKSDPWKSKKRSSKNTLIRCSRNVWSFQESWFLEKITQLSTIRGGFTSHSSCVIRRLCVFKWDTRPDPVPGSAVHRCLQCPRFVPVMN